MGLKGERLSFYIIKVPGALFLFLFCLFVCWAVAVAIC